LGALSWPSDWPGPEIGLTKSFGPRKENAPQSGASL
jgi:hypothetical protein